MNSHADHLRTLQFRCGGNVVVDDFGAAEWRNYHFIVALRKHIKVRIGYGVQRDWRIEISFDDVRIWKSELENRDLKGITPERLQVLWDVVIDYATGFDWLQDAFELAFPRSEGGAPYGIRSYYRHKQFLNVKRQVLHHFIKQIQKSEIW